MTIIENEMIREMILRDKKRMEDRSFSEYRVIKIEKGKAGNAEGSAWVEIGNTKVLAGVKLEAGDPFPDMPNEGILVVNAEFVPFSYPEVLPGPPDENAIELARVVDRIIRESDAIDMESLVIENTKKVWKIMVDILVLDDDGNLKDAATLASMVSILTAKFPSYKIENDEVKINYEEKTEKSIPVKRIPVAVTIAKISDEMLIDPNGAEEKAADAILTIGLFEENGKDFLCALQKAGSGGFTKEEIEKAIDIALEQGKKIKKLILENI